MDETLAQVHPGKGRYRLDWHLRYSAPLRGPASSASGRCLAASAIADS